MSQPVVLDSEQMSDSSIRCSGKTATDCKTHFCGKNVAHIITLLLWNLKAFMPLFRAFFAQVRTKGLEKSSHNTVINWNTMGTTAFESKHILVDFLLKNDKISRLKTQKKPQTWLHDTKTIHGIINDAVHKSGAEWEKHLKHIILKMKNSQVLTQFVTAAFWLL